MDLEKSNTMAQRVMHKLGELNIRVGGAMGAMGKSNISSFLLSILHTCDELVFFLTELHRAEGGSQEDIEQFHKDMVTLVEEGEKELENDSN